MLRERPYRERRYPKSVETLTTGVVGAARLAAREWRHVGFLFSARDAASPDELPLDRLQGFSDGVFAIALTLLVLDLGVSADAGSTCCSRYVTISSPRFRRVRRVRSSRARDEDGLERSRVRSAGRAVSGIRP
jgi:hypothetical protein